MRRVYNELIEGHLAAYRQMVFLAGPRQVGKTTISQMVQKTITPSHYLNWDVQTQRKLILAGAEAVAEALGLNKLTQEKPLVVFDELHKYGKWKNFLKGFYDLYHQKIHIIVTGSAKLDIHRRANDSLMGRYFLYRIHPLTVAECLSTELPVQEIQPPKAMNENDFERLWTFGGFPEPYLQAEKTFFQRWRQLRQEQLFRDDIRELSHIQEIAQLEVLAELLSAQTGQLLNRSNLANKVNVGVNTITRWINTLENFYYCFLVKPWSKNITRSLIKEPKVYLWDWTSIEDVGARSENFVAAHLLKAVHCWTDRGLGQYALHFIRDKDKREVDFLVTKNKEPWFLVEVKHAGNQGLSDSLYRFQAQTGAKHAFQVVIDEPYVAVDCFQTTEPVIVPARTFLSQLI